MTGSLTVLPSGTASTGLGSSKRDARGAVTVTGNCVVARDLGGDLLLDDQPAADVDVEPDRLPSSLRSQLSLLPVREMTRPNPNSRQLVRRRQVERRWGRGRAR